MVKVNIIVCEEAGERMRQNERGKKKIRKK